MRWATGIASMVGGFLEARILFSRRAERSSSSMDASGIVISGVGLPTFPSPTPISGGPSLMQMFRGIRGH